MSNLFNKLLVILCMVDLLVILPNLILACNTLLPPSSVLDILIPWSDGLCHVAISASVFMTIAITVERYYVVSSPYTYQTRLLKKGFWWILFSYVLPVIVTAILLNIPKMLQLGKVLSMTTTSKSVSRQEKSFKFSIRFQQTASHPSPSSLF